MVPDFRLMVPSTTGGTEMRLAELKVISCCPSRYKAGAKERAVDRRARQLSGEYSRKARDVDRKYVGTEEGELGPVERQLNEHGDLLGLVVGAFGKVSEDTHNLIKILAEAKVANQGLARGKQGTGEETGMVVGHLRRRLSVIIKRSQAECLLSRLSLIGGGADQANKIRQWVALEEERMRRERAAQWLARVRGTNIIKKGRFMAN